MKTNQAVAETGVPGGVTHEQLAAFYRSAEGQEALRSAMRPGLPRVREAMKPEEVEKFYLMAEKSDVQYVRVDPKTREPLEEAKEFFWRIQSPIIQVVGATDTAIRLNFLIQKYWRNRTYTTQALSQSGGETLSRDVTTNEAYIVREKDRFGGYTIKELGERMIDGADFLEQFKRDAE